MSEPVPWKVGTTFRTSFDYAVTGLSDSDFTKELMKDGVNVAAPPGITITNISAGRRYDVAVSGTTGFPSATGTYTLTISRTSIPNDRWDIEVVVNSNGLPSGTTGLASFTSTTANGRVTDGTSALQYATVYVRRASGAILTTAVTDSSGNWGPVYFDADGTYSLVVQRSGYSAGTGTVTVSGSTATGPGADITLTASASASTILASSLWAYARRMFHSRNGTKSDTEVRESVNDALDMISSQRDWPWYETLGRINLQAAYSTGTVAVTNGSATVTLTGGTFPSWAASGDIWIDGMWLPVLTRDSNTQVTLESAWHGASLTGETYVLAQTEYALPSDCRAVQNIIQQSGWLWGPDPVSRWRIDILRQTWAPNASGSTGPWVYAIDGDSIVLWPYHSQAVMASVLYLRKPAALTSPTDTADWDPNQIELLRRAIDYQVSLRGECVAGDSKACYDRFREALARCTNQDRTARPRRVLFRDGATPGGLPNSIVVP